MRLIDADALRKQFEDRTLEDFTCYHFLTAIDNSPTVEPCYQTTSCLECKMYDKENYYCPRFCEVIRSAIEERQQGEWIKDIQGNTICSNCGVECLYSEDGMLYSLSKYCPNCGASMKPKTCTNCETFGQYCGDCEVGDDD